MADSMTRRTALALLVTLPVTASAQFPNTLPQTTWYQMPADGFRRLWELHNAERARHGLPPLTYDPWLQEGAQQWATTAAYYRLCGHKLPCIGYAENCGQGQRSQDEIHAGWMSSPGHRANVVSPAHRWVGFGVANGQGGPYWVARYR